MNKASSEKTKKIVLGALFALMAVVAVYQFFLKTPAPRSRSAAQNSNRPAASGQPPARSPAPDRSAPADQEKLLDQQLAESVPLDLAMLKGEPGSASVGPRGNIFAYYVPPPKPPPPPPPPPPIAVRALQPQSVVAGTPRTFTLTVIGTAFPDDAQIIIDGRPRETKRVNQASLSTEVQPQEYSSARSLSVEVKSQSDPGKYYSNSASFVIQQSPDPPFKYVGRIGKLALLEMSGTKELTRLGQGDTVRGVWRIESISDGELEVIHTQYEIKKKLPLPSKKE
ncbi:MAG: hypothetical protein L0229_29560 [Blastocatellia bacterium]|nr:hypothetical protein [Blastocatellia bacterium]